ncbi:hypothetical protein HYH02_004080 [Chlamydomonas schloesseri]|uniref:Disease resistance R13L4/SHOC-2-like LRR domain-containing protein n=1 Tax=Chlamydomonas schloesseri TaxID=2026947 RepID=A0A835WPH7_9CHLO|nr:hypothetical protein HYH02_004080 [Chlamydomonas schloesseri]|eukprot:KAG2451482.1 hypothetical protein HYH02_004080 [Chlamydomonas schloesseri]
MGNCCAPGSGRGDGRGGAYVQMGAKAPSKAQQQQQAQTWSKTGIVGLRDQGIKELPTVLSDISDAVKVIDATNNRITALPAFLPSLANLQRLTLTNNLLTVLVPPGVCPGLISLKLLVLDDNQLGDLPDDIGALKRLERLSVSGNRLRTLPDSIGQLEALQSLVVSRNCLEQLPDSLAGCSRLEELDAQSNDLAVVPAALGGLKRLKALQLDNNRVFAVPSDLLYGCVALQTLSLHGCPIKPDELQETPGFKEFDERRKQKYDKVLAGGALLGARGLDEGVDREVSPPRPR